MLLQRFLHNGNTAPTLSQTTDYRQRRVLYSLYLSIPFDDNGQWTTDYGVLYYLYPLSFSIPSIPFDDYGVLYSSILFYTLYTFLYLLYSLHLSRPTDKGWGAILFKYRCNDWNINILERVTMFCNCYAIFITC